MSNIYDLQTQIAYLDILKRKPTLFELNTYSPLLANSNSGLTPTQLESNLKLSTEYLKLVGLHSGDTSFSNYTIRGSNLSSTNFSGLNLANGKLALITSDSYNDVAHSYISTNFDFNDIGTYQNNVTEVFKYTTVNLIDRDSTLTTISNVQQNLNMLSANFSTNYNVKTNNIDPSANISIDVTSDIRVLRQLPYCTLQTFTLSNISATANIDIYHNLTTPDTIENVKYNNNLINTVINNESKSLYFFQANGILKDINKQVSTCCGYIYNSNVTYKGYNIDTSDINTAYNKFTLQVTQGVTSTFHIISSTMTQLDFEKPDIETQRILINVLTNNPQDIIDDHVSAWSKLWETKIEITPKDNIQPIELDNINTINKHIKLSLFNVYSVVRDDFNVDINPLNISSVDIDGHIFWNGELWFLPVLTLLMPKAARSLLDYRYHQLETAIKLAAAHGYKGSKYAYQNDTNSYKNIYWNTISPLQIFNTGLISVSVWNYYRVSRDLDWLTKKGFEILKNNADFFVSKLEKNKDTGKYDIKNTIGMDNTVGNNNTLTNYVAKLALSYALQAKYELNYVYAVDWEMYIKNIQLQVVPNPTPNLDNLISTNDDNTPSTLEILEPLIILHPYYSEFFFKIKDDNDVNFKYTEKDVLKHNIISCTQRLDSNQQDNSYNRLILASLFGRLAQLEVSTLLQISAIETFSSNIESLFTNATLLPWKTFYNSNYKKSYNDINVSSMFLLSILSPLAALTVRGSVDSNRTYSPEFGISSEPSNVFPKTWKALELYGIGLANKTLGDDLHYCITNQILYP